MALQLNTIVFGTKAKYVMDATIIGVITEIRPGFSLGLGSYNAYSVWDPRRNHTYTFNIWQRDPFLNIYRSQTGTVLSWDYYIEDANVVIDSWKNALIAATNRLRNLKEQATALGISYV